mgnify:CR=1 FL=1
MNRHSFSKSSPHFCCSIKEHPNRPWICMPDSSSTFPKAEDKSITEKSALYSRSSREKVNLTTSVVWSVPSIPNCCCWAVPPESWKNSDTLLSRTLMLLPVSSKKHRFLACAFTMRRGKPTWIRLCWSRILLFSFNLIYFICTKFNFNAEFNLQMQQNSD